MMDYNCERERMGVSQSRQYIQARKGRAVGNGLVMYLSMMLPFVGAIFIAPFSAIAATLDFYKNYQTTDTMLSFDSHSSSFLR
jgi:hypothetical protein